MTPLMENEARRFIALVMSFTSANVAGGQRPPRRYMRFHQERPALNFSAVRRACKEYLVSAEVPQGKHMP